ncbi:MAG: DUF87 domain-containing protein [Acidimicrobiia bacterium]
MAAVDPDQMYLGADLDPATGRRSDQLTGYDPADLVTHGVIVGMTGSGKTGLGVVLLEEALLQGVPCLIIDPKGDLGNLALTFPELEPAQFRPWVDEQQAARDGLSPDEAAAKAAQDWREGLASWGIDGERIRALRDGAPVTLYTPGSTTGVPLNLVGSLQAPPAGTDEETLHDEVEGLVSGLLGLAGIDADPLTSPEHILLTNLIIDAWANGRDLDLAALIGLVQQPTIRKLGVLDLDSFFPAKERTALALRLNGLLASPSFRAWSLGEPLAFDALLHGADGRPRAAVIGLSHLADAERQFVVTLLLSKLITWMRRQSGTTSLRALVYMDEVFGYVPPNAMPPAKKPILTILKQARAFGVGMVLATQNPVDVDYKALSNAGTWMVGRLQTERDKARLLEGLTAASGSVEPAELDRTISALGKRQFVLQRAGAGGPKLFTTRWAMSYLRGPLDRDQIARLKEAAGGTPPAAGDTPHTEPTGSPAVAVRDVADDETTVPPAVADGVTVRYLAPDAPWARQVGAVPGGTRWEAALVARVQLRFDDARAGIDERDEWEAVLHPLGGHLDWAGAVEVDHDDRDLHEQAPAGVRFALPEAPLDRATWFRDAQKRLVEHLRLGEELVLLRNRTLKVIQRPNESEADFRLRLDAAADARCDEEAAALRDKVAARADKLRDAIADARERVEDLEAEQRRKRTGGLMKAAGGLLGAFLGGRRSSRSLARSVANAAGSVVGQSGSATLDNAQQRVERGQRDLAELEADLAEQLVALDRKWDAAARDTDTLRIGLTAADISVSQLVVCWIPTAP